MSSLVNPNQVVKILAISGSLRKASCNSGILKALAAHLEKQPIIAGNMVEIRIADISQLPVYNEDLDTDSPPAAVAQLREQVAASDAFIFATPENNYSVSAAMKNAIDWCSRKPSNLWKGKSVGLVGAGGGCGTARAQLAVRNCAVFLDMVVANTPEVCINRFAEADAFDADGLLVSPKWLERVLELTSRVVTMAGRLKIDPPKPYNAL